MTDTQNSRFDGDAAVSTTAGDLGAFEWAVSLVRRVDEASADLARQRHGQLTKPAGSLGRIEALGIQLASIARVCPPPVPQRPAIAVFAGDHGVVAQGVTPWPSSVTAGMVANFCNGGAAISVLARRIGASLIVVDVGVESALPLESGLPKSGPVDGPLLRRSKVAYGTADLSQGPAMSRSEVAAALDVGAAVAQELVGKGADLLVTGEMGIGNTTPSAAIICALSELSAHEVVGRGTGVDDEALAKKQSVVSRAVGRIGATASPQDILAEVGGFEIAALVGFIVGGAAAGVPVVIDGVITAAAALCAVEIAPEVLDYLIAGHRSSEPGSAIALRGLGLAPVLDLDLRLGEGSGAALAVPIIQAAAAVLAEMATFAEAGLG